MADDASLGSFDLGLGGLGDLLKQQVADSEEERKKKMLNAGQPNKQVNALGLAAINMLGGGGYGLTGIGKSGGQT